MRRRFGWRGAIALSVTAALAWQGSPEAQQVETTGSRIGTGSTPRVVTRFGTPNEINRLVQLLEAGRNHEAVALAESYLESLEGVSTVVGSSVAAERYDALNGYCVALTRTGRLDDALAACGKAIDLLPNRWTAYNSRGTVELLAGRLDLALGDYERALDRAPNDSIEALVGNNIALVEARRNARPPET